MTPTLALKYWDVLTKIIVEKFSGYEFNIQCGGLRLENNPTGDSLWFSNKVEDGKYRLVIGEVPGYESSVTLATWEMYQMKNCCGVCVSTNATVSKKFRKIGLGKTLNLLRIDIAKSAGYGLLFCTDCLKNKPQQKILDSNGWECVSKFNNPRTGNDLGIHTFNLNDC